MNLLFPQWQGAGNCPRLFQGAAALAAARPALDWRRLPVSEQLGPVENGVSGYAEVSGQLGAALELLGRETPETLYTLGGDCSVELAPVSYLNRRYPGLGVVWFDAHADLQAPVTSPSGHLHGMPLRLLLGEGEGTFGDLLPSSLRPEQVLLAGVRVLDPAEEEAVARLGLKRLTADDISMNPGLVAETVRGMGWQHLYLHIDLDVLEPTEFASLGWPQPGGLQAAALIEAVGALHAEFSVVGGGLTEYLPAADMEQARRDETTALEVLDAWLA